jgi:hypothetical protein
VYTIFSLQYNISLRQLQTNTEQTSEESSSLPEKSSSSTREEQPVLNQINKIKNLTLFKENKPKDGKRYVNNTGGQAIFLQFANPKSANSCVYSSTENPNISLVCQSANMQIFIFETDVSFSLS